MNVEVTASFLKFYEPFVLNFSGIKEKLNTTNSASDLEINGIYFIKYLFGCNISLWQLLDISTTYDVHFIIFFIIFIIVNI